ncbi:MAG: succinate dehydrogenase [Longimicrobiaceae bacterium]
MATLPVMNPRARFGETMRRDRWWASPLAVALGLAACGAYATWAIVYGADYYADPYLSPFYSPCLAAQCPAEIRLLDIGWWPFSPAILIMGAILGFRGTCYYYRKAYYRAFFMDPPACAVGEPRGHDYKGETAFPFVLQNLHRYFLYLSIVIILFLWYDTFHGFFFPGGFGVGVGSLVLLANVTLLTGYLLGCHSLRHLAGGQMDCASCSRFGRARQRTWKGLTFFNRDHMAWAWTSLLFVCLTDLYVRLVAAGVITDVRIL